MSPAAPPPDLECVVDGARAGALLHPLRGRILALLRAPRSASDVAAELGLPRQRVNYHVRELERAGFLRRAGRRKKRNLTEQRYVATARSYVLSPEVLGPLEADPRAIDDAGSAAYLLALAGRIQRELGRAFHDVQGSGERLPTLSMDAELWFESAEQRARFAAELRDAVAGVVARHAAPGAAERTSEPAYRLVLGCHPIPKRSVEDRGDEREREET